MSISNKWTHVHVITTGFFTPQVNCWEQKTQILFPTDDSSQTKSVPDSTLELIRANEVIFPDGLCYPPFYILFPPSVFSSAGPTFNFQKVPWASHGGCLQGALHKRGYAKTCKRKQTRNGITGSIDRAIWLKAKRVGGRSPSIYEFCICTDQGSKYIFLTLPEKSWRWRRSEQIADFA